MIFGSDRTSLPTTDQALAGREQRPFALAPTHVVLGTPMEAEIPADHEEIVFGTGCYWGTEEIFWEIPGVWSTSVGFAGGITPHPTYDEVCTGRTGHAEVVRVVFDPARISVTDLLKVFWETHDPTQGMRQGNDVGSQYRSVIFCTTDEQRQLAESSRDTYAAALAERGCGEITTTIAPLDIYYYAEDTHQQYLAKNPHGYRCHSSAGVPFPA